MENAPRITRYNANQHYENDVRTGLQDLLHPNAWKEILTHRETLERIFESTRTRLQALEPGKNDWLVMQLNPWNEADEAKGIEGLGLQSVSVSLVRNFTAHDPADRTELLLADEWKSPTIGVITAGLVEEEDPNHTSKVEFRVNPGEAEELLCLSPQERMYTLMMKNNAVTGNEVLGSTLSETVPLLVTGPMAVETYIRMKNVPPRQRRDYDSRGVYSCRFLNAKAA